VSALFFDTSGIVKRYVNETGTVWVNRLVHPTARNSIHLARIAGVEVVSVIARRVRSSVLPVAAAAILLADFRHDFANQYRLVAITPRLLRAAMLLAEAHALRGYDAVQLAAALRVDAQRRARRLSGVILVSADAALNAAAQVEGLTVEDPNNHP
jgi:uncharacterized protein